MLVQDLVWDRDQGQDRDLDQWVVAAVAAAQTATPQW
jgi:hypothetical protein